MVRSGPADRTRHADAVRLRLQQSGLARPGPGSVTWTVNREIVVVAGWGRAILLQFAHPLIAAGVAAHSSFDRRLFSGFERLFSTVGAMLALTFGDDDAAVATAARINGVHDHVSGQLPSPAGPFAAGTPYSAHHAGLLQWVHATLLESIPLTYARLVGPLPAGARERYCAEAAIMEPLMGIPPGTLPRTTAALQSYMDGMFDSGTLAVTDTSRRLARGVLHPPISRLLWPAFRPVRLLTIGLLPPRIRDAYGYRWTPRDARALDRWCTAIRRTRRTLPPAMREWPVARRAANRPHQVVESTTSPITSTS